MHQHPSASSTPASQLLGLAAALRRNGGRLALFVVVCTALIAITDYFTRDVIARQAEQQLQQTLQQMLPAHSYDNDLAGSCILLQNREYLGNDAPHPVYVARQGDRISGYIVESVAPNGYSGAIRLLSAVTADGKVSRVQVLEHHETPGLGDKIERSKSSWIDHFTGQHLNGRSDSRWAVRKDGGEFDSFTGATITPRAVVGGVRAVLLLIQEHPELLTSGQPCPHAAE